MATSKIVDHSGNPILTSVVLMVASKHKAMRRRSENMVFINYKKTDPFPEKCMDKGREVNSCILNILKNLHNTHVLVDDFGNIRNTYRKIHLFDVDVPNNMVYKENDFTSVGNDAKHSPAGCLWLTVCYDLRFPELYQQLRFPLRAQVLLVLSAFTKVTGKAHWEILLRARAIETQCYVIAAAQAGQHNKKRESYGDSLIIDPWGKILARLSDHLSTRIVISDVDLSMIDSVRTRMPISEHKRLQNCKKI